MKTISIIFLLLLAGCASTHMKQYIGKDVLSIVLDEGPPENVFDLEDGKRAFQYYWGGGTFAMPQTTNVTANTTYAGNSAWTTATATTYGGGVFSTKGCLITYIGVWNGTAWIIEDIHYPKRAFC